MQRDGGHGGLTQLDADIYEEWVRASGDPDVEIPRWLRRGTPMGIEVTARNVGIFPEVSDECPEHLRRPLEFYNERFVNYTSLEDSPHGEEVLGQLVREGYVKKVKSLSHAKQLLSGATPVTSKLALITTEKDGVLKHRLILDCRVSGANDAAKRYERILLPKAWDVVAAVRDLKKRAGKQDIIELMVLDFSDAFYMLPLLPEERKYFVAHLGDSFYLWDRIAQGSLNGPGVFGRLSALTARMPQALFSPDRVQLQVYTDDPIAVLRGTPRETKRMAAILALRLARSWLGFVVSQRSLG